MAFYSEHERWPPDLSALSPDQQVSFWVGCVQREDVVVESALRGVWEGLVEYSLVIHAGPENYSAYLKGCKVMLDKGRERLSGETVEVGLDVLREADAVHQLRNRLAHDQWYVGPGEDRARRLDHWLSGKDSSFTREIDEFEACFTRQLRVTFRLHALASLVKSQLWPGSASSDSDRQIDYLTVMRDEFTMERPGTMNMRRS